MVTVNRKPVLTAFTKSKKVLHFQTLSTSFEVQIPGSVQHLNCQHLCSLCSWVTDGKAFTFLLIYIIVKRVSYKVPSFSTAHEYETDTIVHSVTFA